jgi:site-specific DNA recombinase
MTDNASSPVAIYARVSTEDQAERQTIQAQLDFLRKYCDLHQISIAGEYIDDGTSGTVPLDLRPEGRRLLDDARARRFGVVLAYRLDRLGRSLTSLLAAHDALDRLGISVRSATEPFDTSTAIGKFVFQLLGSLAELERSTITERLVMGRDRVAKAGRYTGGTIAFGYDVDAAGFLVPSARFVPQLGISEADLVRELFTRLAEGSTVVGEAQRLQALGIPSLRRYGSDGATSRPTVWSTGRLWQMAHNPLYRGQAVIHSRQGDVQRPIPALVDPGVWDAVQVVLARNRKLSKKNAKRVYLLRGLVVCGTCGLGFSGTASQVRPGVQWRHYRCNSSSVPVRTNPADRCRAKTIDADWLEGIVWDDIRHWAEHPGDYLAKAQAQLRERLAHSVDTESERRRLLGESAQKETERERVLTMYRRGRISMDEADRELDDIARETETLRKLVESLRAHEALTAATEAHLTDTAAALGRLKDRVAEIERTGDVAAKREQIELLVQRIEVHTEGMGRRKRATVSLRYAYQPAERQPVVLSTDPRW